MDVAYCEACRHIQPLHVGSRGQCRLNGCTCTGFAALLGVPAEAPVQLLEAPGQPNYLWAIAPSVIAFVIGLVLGLNL